MLVAVKKSWLCSVALMAPKRIDCDVCQLECQSSNVTANVQNDYLLHAHTYTHFQSFSPLISCIIHHALLKFSPCLNKPLT